MIWAGGNIDFIKGYLDLLSLTSRGGTMAASMKDASAGNTWMWDTDKGKKEDLCTWHNKTPHTRLYAPSGADELYSLEYGYYVLGTTHFDWGECTKYGVKIVTFGQAGGGIGGAGYSEDAEKLISKLAERTPDVDGGHIASVHEQDIPLGNAEHARRGNHVAQSNGIATFVNIDPTD